jgi:hypothetical protein
MKWIFDDQTACTVAFIYLCFKPGPDTYNLVRWQISKFIEYGSHPNPSDLRQDTGFVCSFWACSSPRGGVQEK